ncbi:hypothetical protein RhiLY_04889 [Ceratobasidium sp. AG-Ba]|nr:hypothetical protein RhiLY_04889 [Ceratobasidium sp. AG-Ba]
MAAKRPSSQLASPTCSPRLPTDTPYKSSSTSASNSYSNYLDPEQRSSKRSRTSPGAAATAGVTSQKSIEGQIRHELNGAVFHDPKFFLHIFCDDEILEQILVSSELFCPESQAWSVSPPTGREELYYTPILKVLNAIGIAALKVRLAACSTKYVEFLDNSKRLLKSDIPGMTSAPDIVKCKQMPVTNEEISWQDVDLYIEVKPRAEQVRQAIRQSARYARSLLANQLERMFVKTLVICNTTATFLHFDRSGLVYSDNIDVWKDARKFTQAFAGLLGLEGFSAGYNPMFIDKSAGASGLHRRYVWAAGWVYRVVSILCHRKSIRGRATLVMALHRILEAVDSTEAALALEGPRTPNEEKTIDAVLKLLWRDPTRFEERLILKEFLGIYGVCQILNDVAPATNDIRCVVYPRANLSAGPLKDVFGNSNETTDVIGACCDDARELSQLIMQPGRPLRAARDVAELKAGFVGAIMGQWALVNGHVQHRDISIHNILLPYDNHLYHEPEWERLGTLGADLCAREFQPPDWEKVFGGVHGVQFRKAEDLLWKFNPRRRFEMLERVVSVIGPRPRGFLSDVDLASILSLVRQTVTDIHSHRTGTPAFMAVDLLLAAKGQAITHTYLHDLESFFWVLLYAVAEHSEENDTPNQAALDLLKDLNKIGWRDLGQAKNSHLSEIQSGRYDIRCFGTVWANSLAPVIEEFARWVQSVRDRKFDSTADPDACFEQVVGFFFPELRPKQTSVGCTCVALCHHKLDKMD